MERRFVKMHGLGNSYAYIDLVSPANRAAWPQGEGLIDWGALARAISDPRFGVGTDGLILILPGPDEKTPLAMRIFNADGSEGEMCGNGIRCLARYAWERGLVEGRRIAVHTRAGTRTVEVLETPDPEGQPLVRVDMGPPRLDPERIGLNLGALTGWSPGDGTPEVSSKPAGAVRALVEAPVQVGGQTVRLTAVSMGNPHAVVFVESVDRAPVRELGPQLERHPLFPNRVNVEFVEVVSPRRLRMRVWERGSGETAACGTGACASAVAAAVTGRSRCSVEVDLPGGSLQIEWPGGGAADVGAVQKDPAGRSPVFMTGPATVVFEGTLDPSWPGWAGVQR